MFLGENSQEKKENKLQIRASGIRNSASKPELGFRPASFDSPKCLPWCERHRYLLNKVTLKRHTYSTCEKLIHFFMFFFWEEIVCHLALCGWVHLDQSENKIIFVAAWDSPVICVCVLGQGLQPPPGPPLWCHWKKIETNHNKVFW